ncbi:MAG: hypothetical protein M1833_002000 [Piccolia ochrophora]|nr:MAG: hypothetical protein M1833_002000 [Piccolia ochrophora]
MIALRSLSIFMLPFVWAAPTPNPERPYLLSDTALGWQRQTIDINGTSADIYCEPVGTIGAGKGKDCESSIDTTMATEVSSALCRDISTDSASLATAPPTWESPLTRDAVSGKAKARAYGISGPLEYDPCMGVMNTIIQKCITPSEMADPKQSLPNRAGLAYIQWIWERPVGGERLLQRLQFNLAYEDCLP